MKKFLTGLACGILVACSVGIAGAAPLSQVVYQNDFENGIDSNWTNANITSTGDNGFNSTNYLGNYSGVSGTTLTLNNLPAHDKLAVQFDLYLFSSWDGENLTYGKDYFSVSGDVNGNWTFTNHQPQGQSYPGTPTETYGSGAGQTQVYRQLDPTGSGDAFTIAHTGDTFTIAFGGPTTQSDEWWGIDNVKVTTTNPVPLPAALYFFGTGIAGMIGSRFRRRKNLA